MPKFTFIYRGGNPPKTPEEGQLHMTKWRAWRDDLGATWIYPGMPFAKSVTVSTDGVENGSGDIPMSGISIIEVDNLETAQKIAQSCPHLNLGGDIIVAQGMDMEM